MKYLQFLMQSVFGAHASLQIGEWARGWWSAPSSGACRGMDKRSRSRYRPGSKPAQELPCRVTKAARAQVAK